MLIPSIFGEDLFDDFMRFPTERQANRTQAAAELMRTDVRDVDGNYELYIDLPGYKKEDLKIHLKEGYLTITAARQIENDENNTEGKYVRRERYMGSCSRSFFVGKNLHQDNIRAKYENGVLKVTFPKEENRKEIEEKKYISIEG